MLRLIHQQHRESLPCRDIQKCWLLPFPTTTNPPRYITGPGATRDAIGIPRVEKSSRKSRSVNAWWWRTNRKASLSLSLFAMWCVEPFYVVSSSSRRIYRNQASALTYEIGRRKMRQHVSSTYRTRKASSIWWMTRWGSYCHVTKRRVFHAEHSTIITTIVVVDEESGDDIYRQSY